MGQDPGNEIERRMAICLEAWSNAAEEHLVPKPGALLISDWAEGMEPLIAARLCRKLL
jgi:hypothetical protein